MDNVNVTFSLPTALKRRLQTIIGKRGLSLFVAEAIERALDERTDELRTAYKRAKKDLNRKVITEELAIFDGV